MKHGLNITENAGIVGIAALVLYSLFFIHNSHAQAAPEFMATWQAFSYTPADYEGRTLPNGETPIEMAFELLENGRPANLSRTEVRWFVGSNLIASGTNLRAILFTPPALNRDAHRIRIEIPNFRGSSLTHRFTIPVVNPEIIIETPIDIATRRAIFFTARPFFFNVTSLSQLAFTWNINGVTPAGTAERPQQLQVDRGELGAGANLIVSVTAHILGNELERASATEQITLQ